MSSTTESCRAEPDNTLRIPRVVSRLIIAHLLLGVGLAVVSPDEPSLSSGLFIATNLCQANLLGMWVGFSRWPAIVRTLVLVGGIYALGLELSLGLNEALEFEIGMVVGIPAFSVALTCWAFRSIRSIVPTSVASMPASSEIREGLQFTLWHLFLLTSIVAVLLSVGRWILPELSRADVFFSLLAFGICNVAIGLISLWALLGLSHLAKRLSVLAVVCVATAYLAGQLLNHMTLFWTCTVLAEAALLIGSLAIVRFSGIRLMSIRQSRPGDWSGDYRETESELSEKPAQ